MAEVAHAVAAEGLTEVPPFDDPAVIAGQGTLGLEIIDRCPACATVLVPLSGGGLAAGVAAAVKARVAGARVIGVSMAARRCDGGQPRRRACRWRCARLPTPGGFAGRRHRTGQPP